VTFSDDLRDAAAKAWDAAVGHRFVAELWAGRVEPAVLADLLVQDRQVLAATGPLIDRVGLPVEWTGPRRQLSRREANYLDRAADALDVPLAERSDPVLDPAAAQLCALLGTGGEDDRAGDLAVLVAAEWLRHDCADRPNLDPPTEPLQREWIEIHRGTPYEEWVRHLRGELDRVGPGSPGERRERVCALFVRVVELELALFDGLYA
jgi:thiaminase (transcriptional activator TenA)